MSDLTSPTAKPKSKGKDRKDRDASSDSDAVTVKFTVAIQASLAPFTAPPATVYDARCNFALLSTGATVTPPVSQWQPSNTDQSLVQWSNDYEMIVTRDVLLTMEREALTINFEQKEAFIPLEDPNAHALPSPTVKKAKDSKPSSAAGSKKKKDASADGGNSNPALDDVPYSPSSQVLFPLSSLLSAPHSVTYNSHHPSSSPSVLPSSLSSLIVTVHTNTVNPIPPSLLPSLLPLTVLIDSIEGLTSEPLSYPDMNVIYRPVTLSFTIANSRALSYQCHWQLNHIQSLLLPQSMKSLTVFLCHLTINDWLSLLHESHSGLSFRLHDRDHRCVKTIEEAEREESERKLKQLQAIEAERKKLKGNKNKPTASPSVKSPANKSSPEPVSAAMPAPAAEAVVISDPFLMELSLLQSKTFDARSNVYGVGDCPLTDLFRASRKFNSLVQFAPIFPVKPLKLIPPQRMVNPYVSTVVHASFVLQCQLSDLPTKESLIASAPYTSLVAAMPYHSPLYSQFYNQLLQFNDSALTAAGTNTNTVRGALSQVVCNSDERLTGSSDYVSGMIVSDGDYRWIFMEGLASQSESSAINTIIQQYQPFTSSANTSSNIKLFFDSELRLTEREFSAFPLSLYHVRLHSPLASLLSLSSIHTHSFDTLCHLQAINNNSVSSLVQLRASQLVPSIDRVKMLEKEFGSAVSDSDRLGAELVETEKEARKRALLESTRQTIELQKTDQRNRQRAAETEKSIMDDIRRKSSKMIFSVDAEDEALAWKTETRKLKSREDENAAKQFPVFEYSNKMEYEHQLQRLREYCHSNPNLYYTFHPDYLASSIPYYESKEQYEKSERVANKAGWKTTKGFLFPSSNNTKPFSLPPPLNVSERQAEENEKNQPNFLTVEQDVDRQRRQRHERKMRDKELKFDLTPVFPSLFNVSLQRSIHVLTEQESEEQRASEQAARREWESRVLVKDSHFRVSHTKSINNCKLSALQPILQDPPKKQALRMKKVVTTDGGRVVEVRNLAVEPLPVSITNTDAYCPPSEFQFRDSTALPRGEDFVRYTAQHTFIHKGAAKRDTGNSVYD